MSSDKKHLKRSKERKFHGNRFTQKIDLDVETTGSVEIDQDLDLDSGAFSFCAPSHHLGK